MAREARLGPVLAALLLIGPFANARLMAADGAWSTPATVARLASGNLLDLADGRVVRLAGIRLPDDDRAPDLAKQAREALAALTQSREVQLDEASLIHDRHGRLVAQVQRPDGLWLQGALLEVGLAQVQTRPGEVSRAAAMLAREQAARDAGRGLWAQAAFAPQPANGAGRLVGSFQIVEGRVVRVAPTERFVYLNFGQDWRSDFTVRVPRDTERSLRQAGIDLERLAGREVEVRGFVLEAGGPLIELSHPEQLQVRSDAAR
jgi:endonuclease YncB( thermonuclease family)